MRAAPASATAMATATAGGMASPSTRREKARVKRGAVFTSRTEAATDVKDRLAIQVAKCRPRATPDAIIAQRRRARQGRPGPHRGARGEGRDDQGGQRDAVEGHGQRRGGGEPDEDRPHRHAQHGQREESQGLHAPPARGTAAAAAANASSSALEAIAAALGEIAASAALAAHDGQGVLQERADVLGAAGGAREHQMGAPFVPAAQEGEPGALGDDVAGQGAQVGGSEAFERRHDQPGGRGGGDQAGRFGFERALEQRAAPAVRVRGRVAQAARGFGQGLGRGRKQRRRLVDHGLALVERGHRAIAADEADAGPALVALVAEHDHHPDLRRVARMGAPARLAVEPFRLHDADAVAGLLGRAHAEVRGLGPRDGAHGDRPALPDHVVGPALRASHRLRRQRGRHVDGGDRLAEMEARGGRPRAVEQRARQQMLPVMLLAVVPSAGLVDATVDLRPHPAEPQDVDDGVSLMHDGHHRHAVQEAGVPGLAAALRVERGLVEDDRRTAFVGAALDDAGVELEEVGVLAVEQPRHARAGAGPSQRGSMRSTYL